MKPSLLYKILGAIVGVTTVTLLITLLFARWSFDRGFLEYINSREMARLETLAARLSARYQTLGSWTAMYDSPPLREIERSAHAPVHPPPRSHPPRHPPSAQPPPRGEDRRPPPHHRGGPPPLLPTVVADADGRAIAGDDAILASQYIAQDIIVDGERVGFVAARLQQQITGATELGFSAQQRNATIVVALVSLLLSAAVAAWLAGSLVRPVRASQEAVARLRQGDYDSQIVSTSRDELGTLMKDLERLAATLKANQASRRTLFADISHELRTPVSVLRGEMESMQDGLRPMDARALASLAEEVNNLNKLIDDLYQLAVSDVGGLAYHFEQIDLKSLINSCIEALGAPAGVTLSMQLEQVSIAADEGRLRQLVMNLLNNSLAYTDVPGEIDIQLTRLGDEAILRIADSAPGVPADELAKLFEPLFRVDKSRNRQREGAGLGLAIAMRITEAHAGTITAAPSELGGITIEVRLPV